MENYFSDLFLTKFRNKVDVFWKLGKVDVIPANLLQNSSVTATTFPQEAGYPFVTFDHLGNFN